MKIITVTTLILISVFGIWLYFSGQNKNITENITATNTPTENNSEVSQSPLPNLPETISATISTKRGDIELELYPRVAPKTVANFINLAGEGFYDGLTFHRVVTDFVIQGGDPNGNGTGGPGYTFEDEINPKSLGLPDDLIAQLESAGYTYNYSLQSLPVAVGSLAMANAGPNTNGSQFFIVTEKDQSHLNGLHTVFGKVIKGMETVKNIQQGDIINKISVSLSL